MTTDVQERAERIYQDSVEMLTKERFIAAIARELAAARDEALDAAADDFGIGMVDCRDVKERIRCFKSAPPDARTAGEATSFDYAREDLDRHAERLNVHRRDIDKCALRIQAIEQKQAKIAEAFRNE